MTSTAQTPRLIRAGAPVVRARFGLVAIHGRGADAAGMVGFAEGLGMPDVAVLAPEAPGRSWWPTSFLAPTAQMELWVQRGVSTVQAAVDALLDEGLPRGQIVVAGFSQGACLALEYVVRSEAGLGGVVAMSGGLVGTGDSGDASDALYGHADKAFTYETDLTGLTAHIGVHDRDPHIPVKRARDSADVLQTLGAQVSLAVEPGAAHGVLQADVAALRAMLNRV